MRAFADTINAGQKGRTHAPNPTLPENRLFQTSSFLSRPVIQRKSDCSCGGCCPSCQAKSNLNISQPDDSAEIEADQIADKVMRMPIGEIAGSKNEAKPIHGNNSSSAIQRKCDACEEEDEKANEPVMRKETFAAAPNPPPGDTPQSIRNVINSGGHPLDRQTRSFFEPRFGMDLSHVRIHIDPVAGQSARAINARAYTLGSNIVFGSGEYQPESEAGKHLLAHELAHTIQPNASKSIHRKGSKNSGSSGGTSPSPAPAAQPPIVEDVQLVNTGQMRRTEFLNTLRDRLIAECDVELAKAGRTAQNCPYILRSIEYYRYRPLSQLLRLIRVFARPAAGATAQAMITATVARARKAAKKLAEQGGPRLQSMTESGGAMEIPHNPAAIRSKMGSGAPLSEPVRRRMEHLFEADFSSVRIHTDAGSSRQASDLRAKAFTIGSDIAFAQGRFAPETREGERLLAHELAHTIQQGGGSQNSQEGPGELELEGRANEAADTIINERKGAGEIARSIRSGPRVSRDPVDDAIIIAALVAALETGGEVAVVEGGAIVVAEVGTEVALVEAAPLVVAEATPLVVAETAPLVAAEVAPVLAEAAPAVVQAAPSAFSTAATVTAATAAATTLSSDSPISSGDHDQDLDEERRRGRCSYMSVAQQFGRYPCHAAYASSISGVSREVRVTTPEGISVDFDAMDWGENLYEVKTGYRWMVFTPARQNEIASRFWNQAVEQMLVAEECGHPLTWYFNDPYVASFFGAENSPYPAYFTAPMPVPVWYRPFDCNVDSDD